MTLQDTYDARLVRPLSTADGSVTIDADVPVSIEFDPSTDVRVYRGSDFVTAALSEVVGAYLRDNE